MADAFRTPIVQQAEKVPEPGPNQAKTESSVEVPFTSYEVENPHPYLVDHFELGDRWQDSEGGFSKEISTITEYLDSQIRSGKLNNSIDSVKKAIKQMEKMTNIDTEDRKTIKLDVLASYTKFLMEADEIKYNGKRYGNY